jgi:hypothetical protein
MALSKPAPMPYSSYHSNGKRFDDRVVYNYQHYNLLAHFDYFGMKHILSTKFLTLMAGNYQPGAFVKLEAEQRRARHEDWKDLLERFGEDCFALDEYQRDRENIEHGALVDGPNSIYGVMYERMMNLLEDIPEAWQTVLNPVFSRINEINFEMYEPYSFPRLKAMLLSSRSFDDIGRRFIMRFFHFSCYALPSERVQIIELAIRRGRGLLQAAGRAGRKEQDPAKCLWIAIQFYDHAKSSQYNIKFGSCRADSRSQPAPRAFMDRFEDRMHKLTATEPRAGYALTFLAEFETCKHLPHARLSDVLVHMSPLFAFEYECGVAFASGLLTYTRTTRDKHGNAVTRDHVAPIAQLGADILRIVWSYARRRLSKKTHPIPRKAPSNE